MSLAKLAHKAETGTGFGILVGTASHITSELAFPYGANFAEVAVNVRTGQIRLDKFYALLDCGTPINRSWRSARSTGDHAGHRSLLTEEICYDGKAFRSPGI